MSELFKCELPLAYVRLHHICISIILRKAILPCFPQYNCAHQNFKEKLCPELDGPRAATAPHPLRTPRLTHLAFAPPCTPIYCENTGIRTLPYFQTATLSHACHVPYFQTCTLSHTCHVSELFKCELPLAYVRLHHICISIILRKAILPCFPQYNCAHQNFKEKLCPELDRPRAATAPQPPRTPRLTPLAFAPPCTPIYCENTGIRTLPYFQTATLSHACHVPYFQTCTLSHTCHVSELFKCELPLAYVRLHHICISIILRKAILPCFPQYNCAHQNFKEKLCPELGGPRAATAPQPPRTPRLTPLAFAPPCTPIYCENTGIRTLPYFQTATLSHAWPRSLLSNLHIVPHLPRE